MKTVYEKGKATENLTNLNESRNFSLNKKQTFN